MSAIIEAEPTLAAVTDVGASDRRRPGRSNDISPALLPLLRNADSATTIDFDEDIDQTAALRGLFFGVVLSAPLWVAIAYVGTWFLT